MKQNIFKTNDIYNNFIVIINNINYALKSYGFKRVAFEKIINSNGRIQYKTAIKLLRVYNDYYNTGFEVKDIFNNSMVLNNQSDKTKVIFEYINDGNLTLYNFIDDVLSLFKNGIMNEKIQNVANGYVYKSIEKDSNNILNYSIGIVIIVFLFTYYKIIFNY